MIAAGATDLNLAAAESNLRVATCAFLAARFPVFPAGRDLFFRQVFKNSTFRPSVDEPLSYPRAENLVTLLYHSPIGNPYAGMAPLRRHGGRDPPASGMDGFTFSFAAKYSRSIAAFVTRKLGAPPRFAIEVGSYLGAGEGASQMANTMPTLYGWRASLFWLCPSCWPSHSQPLRPRLPNT